MMQSRTQFVVSTLVVAGVLTGVGWATGLREVMHTTLLVLGSIAFFPFVLIAAGLGLILVVMVVAALGDGDVGSAGGELLVEGGLQLIPRYYRWLTGLRHPALWGAFAGALLGALLLWGGLGALVARGEAETARILEVTRADLEARYETAGEFPEPTASGALELGGDLVRDGFGTPLRYEVTGAWKLRAFELRSLGYDQELGGGDDLCMQGASSLRAAAEEKARALVARVAGPDSAWSDRFAAVLEIRCSD